MPWDGNQFTLLYDFEADRNLGPPDSRISATKMMETLRDLADGLERSIASDGSTVPSENIDWDGHRIVNAGDAEAATDYVTAGQVPSISYAGVLTETSGANTLSGTLDLAPTPLPAGFMLTARFASANSAAMTLAINAGTRLALTDRAANALVAGDIVGGSTHLIQYDGSQFRVVTPVSTELVASPDGVGIYNLETPLTGNGTSTPLSIDFEGLDSDQLLALATALMGDAAAAAAVVAGLPNAPARLTISGTAPTGANAIVGCFWFKTPELILFMRTQDQDATTVWFDISTPNGGTGTGPASVATGNIQDSAVTNAKLANAAANTIKGNTSASTAVVTDLTGAQANLLLNDGSAVVTVASASGTYTPNMASGMFFDLIATGVLLIAAPTNVIANQQLIFRIQQDATGSRAVSWNAAYNFGASGAPTLSTAAGDADYVTCIVRSSGNIEVLSVVVGY